MPALSSATLPLLSASVTTPGYDRAQVRAGIVHLGVGGFHRSHQAMYLDRLMSRGQALDRGIVGVGVLPGDRRSVSVQLDGIWHLFGVGADLTIAPTVAAADQEPVATAPVTESITVAAVPVPQLLVILGVALILAALLAGRSRSRRRIAALVQQAKEEGLREGARVSS